jgi:hypothetical protein
MSKLRLLVDGEPGTISLRTYLGMLGNTIETLRVLDRAISRTRRGTLDWFIDDVQAGSLVTDLHSDGEYASAVQEAFIGGVAILEREASVPAYFSESEIKRIGWIAHELGRDGATGFRVIDLDEGRVAHITEITEAHVKEATAAKFESIGSVVGTLEMVSIHGGTKANVYQTRTHKAVRCNVPQALVSDLLPQVTALLGQAVIASGRIYRNAQGEPIRLTLRNVTPVGTEPTDLPTVDEIAGSDPNITGDVSVDEFIRRLRDA